MTKKLVLHIGTHKTGTTALQGALNSNASLLAANGYAYPAMPLKWSNAAQDRNAHWLNVAALREVAPELAKETEKIEPCRQVCRECIGASGKTVVLSDERLWYNGTKPGYWEQVRRILGEIGAESVEVVVYLRRQDLFIESLWLQFLKSGRLRKTLQEYAALEENRLACDYAAGVRRLYEVFGREHVAVRIYDRSQLEGGDTVLDFLKLLGIDEPGELVRPESSANYSLTPSVAFLKLAANRSELYPKMGKRSMSRQMRALSAQDEDKRGSFFTPQQRRELLERCQEGNAWLAREVMGIEDGVLFAVGEGELDRPAFEPDPLKIAQQACSFTAAVLEQERAESQAKIAKLEKRAESLELSAARRLIRKVKALVPRLP